MKLTSLSRRLLLPALLCSAALAAHAQNVGVGTLTPSEKLDVVGGNLKLSTSGSYLIFPDGTTQGTAASGTGFIVNGTTQQGNSNFNISGSGYVGGRLGIGVTSAAQSLDVGGGILARSANAVSTQGAYLQWNRTGGEGETWLLNQQGGGAGNAGIRFGGVTTANVATEWGRFLNNGNFGIGTTSPAQKLDVNGNATVGGYLGIGTSTPSARLTVQPASDADLGLRVSDASNGNIVLQTLTGGNSGYSFLGFNGGFNGGEVRYNTAKNRWRLGTDQRSSADALFLDTYNGTTGTTIFTALTNGNLGIGTSNPIAPLHVKGAATTTVASGNAAFFNQGGGFNAISNMSGNKQTTAYFEGGEVWVSGFIVAGNLQTTSDRRIKHVVGLSDRAADLTLLNRLRITDYTYIDQVNNTPGVVKKVIAQEVEQVLPTAVSRSTQALPNVYERATKVSYANGQLTVTTAKPHELPAIGGRMRFYTPANASLDPEVTVLDAHTVRFASPEAHAAGLFVYGKYVDDFRSVDYDALTTLNVSATQELARKVAELEKQNAILQAGSATDHASLLTLQAQMARLLGEGAQAQK